VIRSEVQGEVVWQQARMISGPSKKGGRQLPCSGPKGERNVSKGEPWIKVDDIEIEVVDAHP
jgi:hypothetical protein